MGAQLLLESFAFGDVADYTNHADRASSLFVVISAPMS